MTNPNQSKFKKIQEELARRQHLRFMQYCWPKQDPLVIGLHTRRICERIDKAIKDFENGKSTFLRIKIHQRAGKSDIVSRFLPPRFLALFPDHEIMNVSYSADKAKKFSNQGLKIIRDKKFQELFPKVRLDRSSMSNWSFKTYDSITENYRSRVGQAMAAGLHAGLTGDGYHLGVLDDYCGSRNEAESTTFRENSWNSFTNDFLTRMAPVAITIIVATQWHEDDIHGRIAKRNDPDDPEYDEDFPLFETLSFPASRENAPLDLVDQYPGEYLFLERYTREWYKNQFAQLGNYATSAMMECNPVPRTGGILNTGGIVWHEDPKDFPKDIQYYRVWDYAHTAVKRTGHDPDYTGGTLLGFERGLRNPANNQYMWKIWILDYTQFREGATLRDQRIRGVANKDGRLVKILVETSLDSHDGFAYLANQLGGVYTVLPVNAIGDKMVRCTPIEPIFEACNVHVLKGAWNKVWLTGLQRFDGSGKTHDEMVDNITAGFQHASYRHRAPTKKVTYGRI